MRSRSFRRTLLALILLVSATAAIAPLQRRPQPSVTPQELGRIWDQEHVSPPQSPLLDHAELTRRLEALAAANPGFLQIEQIGQSVEGRSINHVRVGTGPFRVLMWSQMHGDEPTATSALLDLLEYLRRHRDGPGVSRLLGSLTLHLVPMLNPDGAERFQRRNAQSIDVNRDALRLQTPEGRALKALRDRLAPRLGFNLHNQAWRTSVGDPPRPASISLLSVAYDEKRSENEGRRLTKKVCAVIRDALEPFASGQIGRYSDEFEVRAFGDNVTLWGTPVVLIETGPWPSQNPDPALVRLNFVALVAALDAIATGSVEGADPQRYESLPYNESRLFYVLIRNATLISGAGVAPFTADIGIGANRRVRTVDGRRDLQLALSVEDLGDLRTMGGQRTIDATGLTVVPAGDEVEAGQTMDLPDWKVRQGQTIAVGQPARLAILKPAAEPGRFVVDAVFR